MNNPIKLEAMTRAIGCTKSANQHLQLVVDTTEGGGTSIPLDSSDEQIKKLREEMQAQAAAQAAQAAQIAQLKNDLATVSGKVSSFSISVSTPQPEQIFGGAGPWGPAGTQFWTSQDNTPVSYTCPGKEVLAGMTFIMKSDGVGRHPFWVQ
jgi:hypothetical protein